MKATQTTLLFFVFRIIQALDAEGIGMVYNFHHAHHQIDDFPRLIRQMKPYLYAVSLNGLRKEGPKILPLGQGDQELHMLQALKDSGYAGPLGIIGHIEEEDVQLVLERNLAGLQSL